MSADLVVLPADAAVLDATSDPGAFVVAALDRAKSWLAQAQSTDLPDVVEAKARAEAIRVYTTQKELGHDAELAATEIVRRAERRIGELIREGQTAGTILKPGEPRHRANQHGKSAATHNAGCSKSSPKEIAGRTDHLYEIADGISDEQFEAGLAEAKAEGNLSRANVKRKVAEVEPRFKGDQMSKLRKATERHKKPERSEWNRGRPHFNSSAAVEKLVVMVDALPAAFSEFDPDQVDADKAQEWSESLHRGSLFIEGIVRKIKGAI